MRMINVPDGAKHGFPKPLPATIRGQKAIIDWLEKNGCPKDKLHQYTIGHTKTQTNETTFDTILKWILTPLIAWLTLDFSVEYFTGLWGEEYAYRIWIAAAVITGLEIYFLRLAILAETLPMQIISALAGGFIGLVSVLGSLGAFEQGVAKNVLQSDNYVSNQRSIHALQLTNDKLAENISPATFLVTNRRIKENEAKIDSLRTVNKQMESDDTAGSGNALFTSLGSIFGASPKVMARNVNGYTSLAFELALIVITLIGAYRDKQRFA